MVRLYGMEEEGEEEVAVDIKADHSEDEKRKRKKLKRQLEIKEENNQLDTTEPPILVAE